MSGWSDASGHITLWDGKKQRFVDNTNYLLKGRAIVENLYFWELK
ncbi:T6SS effector amidase Tae4 family protein [Helicobacter sp. MIT 11-5569]